MIPADPIETRGSPVRANGTPAALAPIAREVLGWVATERTFDRDQIPEPLISHDELRRIELCALATLDIGMLHDLYCIGPTLTGEPDAPRADLQDER